MPQVHRSTDILIDLEIAGDEGKRAHVVPGPPGRGIRGRGVARVPRRRVFGLEAQFLKGGAQARLVFLGDEGFGGGGVG